MVPDDFLVFFCGSWWFLVVFGGFWLFLVFLCFSLWFCGSWQFLVVFCGSWQFSGGPFFIHWDFLGVLVESRCFLLVLGLSW